VSGPTFAVLVNRAMKPASLRGIGSVCEEQSHRYRHRLAVEADRRKELAASNPFKWTEQCMFPAVPEARHRPVEPQPRQHLAMTNVLSNLFETSTPRTSLSTCSQPWRGTHRGPKTVAGTARIAAAQGARPLGAVQAAAWTRPRASARRL
jgi:hypothetical protein